MAAVFAELDGPQDSQFSNLERPDYVDECTESRALSTTRGNNNTGENNTEKTIDTSEVIVGISTVTEVSNLVRSTALVDSKCNAESQANHDVSEYNQCELVLSETEGDREKEFSNKTVGKEDGQSNILELMDMSCTMSSNNQLQQHDESMSKNVIEKTDGEGESKSGQKVGGEGERGQEDKRDVEGEQRGEDNDGERVTVVKNRKSRLECKECGKRFTRRETYNLHRHFHMHQDEEASLTCKECGLTFQHRSSLIKHRNEHKEKGTLPPPPVSPPAPVSEKKQFDRSYKEETSFECDHCGDAFPTVLKLKLHSCELAWEKRYRCPICRKEFQYRVSINAHMQCHSLDSPFRCLECNKGFQCAATLHIHQRSHAALKPFECPECGMVFRHRSVMEDHRRKHNEDRPYQCNICRKTFKYRSLLNQHQYLHTGQKPYRCLQCGKKFAFAQNIRAHCRQHKKCPYNSPQPSQTPPGPAYTESHSSNNNPHFGRSTGAVGKENTNIDKEQTHVFNCPLCPLIFNKAVELKTHLLFHEAEFQRISNGKDSERVYVCPWCPLTFSNESTLQSHMLVHQVTPTPVKREHKGLSEVKADANDNISGVRSLGDQSEKKLLKCRECGRCFRHRSVLEIHMRIHNKEKPYQCNVCHKSFRFGSYLQQHLIIHTGKKPYKCPDCGKDFAFLQNMKTHQRLHQQKPFRCTQCRKGYSDESQLQRHMLSHTGDKPHKCHLCEKSFGLAYLLRDHLNTHTGERPHRCKECDKSFPWLSSLLVHQKMHMRKRQGHGQPSFFVSQRGRMRGGRGRRGRRWASVLSGGEDRSVPLQPSSQQWMVPQQSPMYASSSDLQKQLHPAEQQQVELHDGQQHAWKVEMPELQQSSMWLSEEQAKPRQSKIQPRPILPKPQHGQQGLGWADHSSKLHVSQEDGAMSWDGKTLSTRFIPSPSKVAKKEQLQNNQQQPSFMDNKITSTDQSPPPNGNQQESSKSSSNVDVAYKGANSSLNHFVDEQASLQLQWPHHSSPQQNTLPESSTSLSKYDSKSMSSQTSTDVPLTASSSDKSDTEKQQKRQQSSDAANSSVLTQMSQSSVVLELAHPSVEDSSNPLGFNATQGVTKPSSLLEKDGDGVVHKQSKLQMEQQHPIPNQLQMLQQPSQQIQQQQFLQVQQQQQNQISHAWVSATPSNQITIQYGSARFPHGDRTSVWGFQATPTVSQALITRPVQQRRTQAQQQLPLVSGPQILINQTSSFISPPLPSLPLPHPIHSVAVGQLGSLPSGLFLSPQGMISERSPVSQTMPLPQLAQQTESHKLGSHIPFASDRRFQCMICGCSLSQELDLQMHYIQHAKGEL